MLFWGCAHVVVEASKLLSFLGMHCDTARKGIVLHNYPNTSLTFLLLFHFFFSWKEQLHAERMMAFSNCVMFALYVGTIRAGKTFCIAASAACCHLWCFQPHLFTWRRRRRLKKKKTLKRQQHNSTTHTHACTHTLLHGVRVCETRRAYTWTLACIDQVLHYYILKCAHVCVCACVCTTTLYMVMERESSPTLAVSPYLVPTDGCFADGCSFVAFKADVFSLFFSPLFFPLNFPSSFYSSNSLRTYLCLSCMWNQQKMAEMNCGPGGKQP